MNFFTKVVLFIIVLILLAFWSFRAEAQTNLILDNFDTYNTGSIENQGNWFDPFGISDFIVTPEESFSYPFSIAATTTSVIAAYPTIQPVNGDVLKFWINVTNDNSTASSTHSSLRIYTTGPAGQLLFFCNQNENYWYIRDAGATTCNRGGQIIEQNLSKNEWHKIELTFTGVNSNFEVSVNDSVPIAVSEATNGVTAFYIFQDNSNGIPTYFDSFGYDTSFTAPNSFVDITYPANSTTTASQSFTLTGEYNLSSSDFEDTGFEDEEIHLVAEWQSYEDELSILTQQYITSVTPSSIWDQTWSFSKNIGTEKTGLHRITVGFITEFNLSEQPINPIIFDSEFFYSATTTTEFFEYGTDIFCETEYSNEITQGICKLMVFLFSAGSDVIVQQANSFKDTFLIKAPWGYATRAYNIVTGSATTTLPALVISFPSSIEEGAGIGDVELDLLIWQGLEGAITAIDEAEVENIEGSPLVYLMGWWTFIWNIVIFLWLLRVIMAFKEMGDFEDLRFLGGQEHGRIRKDAHGKKYQEWSTRDIRKKIRYTKEDP